MKSGSGAGSLPLIDPARPDSFCTKSGQRYVNSGGVTLCFFLRIYVALPVSFSWGQPDLCTRTMANGLENGK
ncbi:RIP metalloprotease RseP [Pantoea sp. S62]|nr:RIP metalloprotease RseP [Pantoea sp. S62]